MITFELTYMIGGLAVAIFALVVAILSIPGPRPAGRQGKRSKSR